MIDEEQADLLIKDYHFEKSTNIMLFCCQFLFEN